MGSVRPLAHWVFIGSWAMYDFAVTIFAMNVISRYFGLWVTETRGGEDWMYSLAFALSTGCAALLMPLVGAWTDRTGRRVPPLRIVTLICVVATGAIGAQTSLAWGLACFALANLGCQLGGISYDALLPWVSQGRQVGWISGLGVACGYVGSVTGLLLVQGAVREHGYAAAFMPTAVLILMGALPCMLLLREHRRTPVVPSASIAATIQLLMSLLRGPARIPGIGRFLVGCFCAINVINTVIMFMAVYAKRTVGLSDTAIDRLLIISTVVAMAGALGSGWLTDRLGPRRCMLLVMGAWCVGMSLAALWPTAAMYWVVGPLIGVCLGATWTSARAYLVALGPAAHIGAMFGLFGLVGRSASNIGPIIWGRITMARDVLGLHTDQLAMGSLLLLMLIAIAILWGIPDARTQRAGVV